MKSPRKIDTIIEPEPVIEGAGVRLKRSVGTGQLDYLDPFLLLDHFASSDPRDYKAGFPLHPHRGIETVTYVLRGEVHHKVTLGNSGSIGAGDIQWMTAGRGIMHEEMPAGAPRRDRHIPTLGQSAGDVVMGAAYLFMTGGRSMQLTKNRIIIRVDDPEERVITSSSHASFLGHKAKSDKKRAFYQSVTQRRGIAWCNGLFASS